MESGASEKEKNEWWLQGFCHDRWKDGAATKSNGRAWRGSMFGEKNWDFTSEQVVFGLSIRWLLKIENIGLWIQGKKKHIVDAVNYQHEQYWPNYRSKVKFTERRLIIHVYSNEFLKLMIYATVRTQMITSWPFGSYHPPQTEKGNGTPLQYSCLKNPMDGGACWAAVHGVAKSQTRLSDFTFMHWRRNWQPTPLFLPGESQGWGSLVGCYLWGCTESDTTEAT